MQQQWLQRRLRAAPAGPACRVCWRPDSQTGLAPGARALLLQLLLLLVPLLLLLGQGPARQSALHRQVAGTTSAAIWRRRQRLVLLPPGDWRYDHAGPAVSTPQLPGPAGRKPDC